MPSLPASRARDRLILYAPTEKSNGHNRTRFRHSSTVSGRDLTRRSLVLARLPLVAAEARDIGFGGRRTAAVSAPQIALCESCPRRFFFLHACPAGRRLRNCDRLHASG